MEKIDRKKLNMESFKKNLPNSGLVTEKTIIKSFDEFKEIYPEKKVILLCLKFHPEGLSIKQLAGLCGITYANAEYHLRDIRKRAKDTKKSLEKYLNELLSRVKKKKTGRPGVEEISSIEEFERCRPGLAETLYILEGCSDKITSEEIARKRKVGVTNARRHVKELKEMAENLPDNHFLKNRVIKAVSKWEGKGRKKENRKQDELLELEGDNDKTEDKEDKPEELPEIDGIYCGKCGGLLLLGQCTRCGKSYKYTGKEERIIVSKAPKPKDRKIKKEKI